MANIETEIKNDNLEGVTNEELKKLLEENFALLKETHEMTHKIKRYITFQKVMSFVYVTLILGPLIFSIIYLPPLFKQIFGQYNDLMNINSPGALLKNLNEGALVK